MTSLDGAVAVITGAGRGLGAALAMTLADAGSQVILCGRNEAALRVIGETIKLRTGRASAAVVLDLADRLSIDTAVANITAAYPLIDILVNNAAAWLERSPDPHSAEEVLSVVTATVSGTFLLTQGLLPLLRKSACPDVVTIGSVNALPNAPLRTVSVPFYAAKHAQAALAEGLHQALAGTPVRSICIHPPDLDDVLPSDPEWEGVLGRKKGERGTSRDVVEAVMFALTRPRHITLSSIVLDADVGGLSG